MTRTEARKRALTNNLSIDQLRGMISAARGRGGMSRVNSAIPLERVLDIYDGALAGFAGDLVPSGMQPDVYRPGRTIATKFALTITNILRDCASPDPLRREAAEAAR